MNYICIHIIGLFNFITIYSYYTYPDKPYKNQRSIKAFKVDFTLFKKLFEIADRLISICNIPLNFDLILQKVFTEYNLMMNFEQYVLVGSTVRSYLSWLKDTGKIKAYFECNQLLWQSI